MMLLVSCGDVNGGKADAAKQDVNLNELEQKYPVAYKNEGEVVPVDTLKVAVVSSSPYKGIFNGFLLFKWDRQCIYAIYYEWSFPNKP